METTFILAQKFGVTPFEIMAQDLDEVILVINFILDSNSRNRNDNNFGSTTNEKEQAKDFWACL